AGRLGAAAAGAAGALAERKPPLREERPGRARHARGQEHPQVTDRQHDVIGGAGHARFAYRDGAVVLLGEIREQLPHAERLAAGNDAERPRMYPAPLVWLQQLLRDRRAHEVRDRGEAGGALSSAACHAGCAEEYHTAGRLLGKALQEAIDDQSAQAVTEEMHRRRLQLAPHAGAAREQTLSAAAVTASGWGEPQGKVLLGDGRGASANARLRKAALGGEP